MFDAIVMLTWSDWRTEMRSNRYHYATRFAQHQPVIFVQPDLYKADFWFENSGCPNITILHISSGYDKRCSDLLNRALLSKNIIRPILWIYNAYLANFAIRKYAALKIYHATEDYFCRDFLSDPYAKALLIKLRNLLQYSDLLVSVSESVQENFCSKGGYRGEKLLLTNGCDFDFYDPRKFRSAHIESKNNVAFYQGGINKKINYKLLYKLIKRMSDWEFWFCGISLDLDGWKEILNLKNVKYFGTVSPEMIREYAYSATVGLIPFIENDWTSVSSFPLKAFEYLACGLPVVSIPIQSLLAYSQVFYFAETIDEFEKQIRSAAKARYSAEGIEQRLYEASKHNYDDKFALLMQKIHSLVQVI